MPRLLLLLPQMPQDPASGAARSMRTAVEMLAVAGWQVRALAATASEGATDISAADFLRGTGLEVTARPPNRAVYRHDRPMLEFTDKHGIFYRLLDTGDETSATWQLKHDSQFNRLYHRELADYHPDIVFGDVGPFIGGRLGTVLLIILIVMLLNELSTEPRCIVPHAEFGLRNAVPSR